MLWATGPRRLRAGGYVSDYVYPLAMSDLLRSGHFEHEINVDQRFHFGTRGIIMAKG